MKAWIDYHILTQSQLIRMIGNNQEILFTTEIFLSDGFLTETSIKNFDLYRFQFTYSFKNEYLLKCGHFTHLHLNREVHLYYLTRKDKESCRNPVVGCIIHFSATDLFWVKMGCYQYDLNFLMSIEVSFKVHVLERKSFFLSFEQFSYQHKLMKLFKVSVKACIIYA